MDDSVSRNGRSPGNGERTSRDVPEVVSMTPPFRLRDAALLEDVFQEASQFDRFARLLLHRRVSILEADHAPAEGFGRLAGTLRRAQACHDSRCDRLVFGQEILHLVYAFAQRM